MDNENDLRQLEEVERDKERDVETLMGRLSVITSDRESPVAKRLIGIVEACSTDELSVEDLAERFSVHYQTMYGNVKSLTNIGLLKVITKSGSRTHFYRTSWEDVPENLRGMELRWRSGGGEFFPVSTYIDRFLFVGPRRLAYEVEMFGRLLVSNYMNKKLEYMGVEAYGVQHDDAIYVRMNASIEFLENMLAVMRQAVESPILRERTGWQMYKMPESISSEDADQIHDEVEMYFQQEGYYDK